LGVVRRKELSFESVQTIEEQKKKKTAVRGKPSREKKASNVPGEKRPGKRHSSDAREKGAPGKPIGEKGRVGEKRTQ